jgi:hypothetical protein
VHAGLSVTTGLPMHANKVRIAESCTAEGSKQVDFFQNSAQSAVTLFAAIVDEYSL